MSFAYGILPDELEARLSAKEFALLEAYASAYMLPHRRQHMTLAHLTHFVGASNGIKDSRVQHYLFEPDDEISEPQDPAKIAARAFGFAPTLIRKSKDGG